MAIRQRGGSFLFGPSEAAGVVTPEDLTPEQRQIAQTAREFVAREVTPLLDSLEQHDWSAARRLLRQAGELGFAGLEVPTAYGGLDLDKITATAVAQELGAAASFAVTYMVHTGIGTLPIVYFGNAEQKRRYLPALATAEKVAAYSLTETGSGSDALGARTVARSSPDGQGYLLRGTKQWTSNAGFADLFVVFAKIGGEHFTAFLVERSTPGVSIGPEEKKMGLRGSSTAQVILNDAYVPASNVLHDIGKGHQVAFNMLNLGRFKLGAVCLGSCLDLLGVSTRYAQERQQFGRPIASFPLVQQKLASMATRSYALGAVVYRIAGLLAEALGGIDLTGDARAVVVPALAEYAVECSLAKVLASETLSFVADEGVQIHGGYGFMEGYAVERAYRDNRINRIFEGTNEINRLLIPETVVRRVHRGEAPAMDLARVVADLTRLAPPADGADPLARERYLLEVTRGLFWLIVGLAERASGDRLEAEQEVLAVAADLAIDLFAMESALIRASREAERRGSAAAALHLDLARACVAETSPRVAATAQRALAHLATGSEQPTALAAIGKLGLVPPLDQIETGRRIAARALASDGWPL